MYIMYQNFISSNTNLIINLHKREVLNIITVSGNS